MFVTSCPRSFAIHKCPKNTDKMAVTIVAIMRIDVYVVVMPVRQSSGRPRWPILHTRTHYPTS